MVCKEEVLLWFKDLDSYKRIDVAYEILNMCLPFELRFLGSCLEELGKHTYQELRGPAITANDVEKLSKEVSLNQGILDESVRHRVLVYLSLLSSRNYSVANWLYKKWLRTDYIEEFIIKEKGKDDVLLSEFLLLYTMGLHHPAFTFDQKQYFSRVLENLIDFRENRVSAKHCALGYPPGFGYPTQKIHDPSTVPVKTAPAPCGDSPSPYHQQPPGLPHMPPPHIDFIPQMWTRPGFPYGAPEVPPFPAPSISPLVSQAASPNQSRSASPHRTHMGVRPPQPTVMPPPGGPPTAPPLNGPPPPVDVMSAPLPPQLPAQLPPDQLSQPNLPMYNNIDLKLADEDVAKLSSIVEEKQMLWPHQGPMNPDVKPNGIRFPHFVGRKPFLVEHMHALSIDGENSLHQSNSSSNSSPNETPPGTPSTTPATTPHGPGRGDKPRPNGMPQFAASPGPPLHDTTSPPPPPQSFNNSSVPYSYPQQFATLPPNRSMFHYNQAYRPTFTQYPNYPTDTSFPTYSFPYIPLIYSSPYPSRTPPGCYNCGAPNHIGSDCTSQNIEEITQKKTYQLEYASPLPDTEK